MLCPGVRQGAEMLFDSSYIMLGGLLLADSLVLGYVLRGVVRAALVHDFRRSSWIDLRLKNAIGPRGAAISVASRRSS
jgi:hypothetical protein